MSVADHLDSPSWAPIVLAAVGALFMALVIGWSTGSDTRTNQPMPSTVYVARTTP